MASIILVDDDEILGRAIAMGLRRAGHEVRPACDGDEALRLFREDPAEIVLTDVVMPGKEGIELIIEFRRCTPQPKVIAMSGGGGVGSQSYLTLARKLGAVATLQKPFTLAQMLAAIRQVVQSPPSVESPGAQRSA